MDPMLIEYFVFFAAVLVIIWAALALNRRLNRHQTSDMKLLRDWVELDTKRPEAREESEQKFNADEDEKRAKLYIRARQNGHHVESQKPPL